MNKTLRNSNIELFDISDTTDFDAEKVQKWISNGAQPTDTVRDLLKKSGVLD